MENENGYYPPCEHCSYKKEHDSNFHGGFFSLLITVVAIIGCVYFYREYQECDSKLQNCIYIDENNSVHSVKNGVDSTLFNSDYLRDVIMDY